MSPYSFLVGTFLVLSVWFSGVATGNECPPPEVLYPCHCEGPYDPVVRCINLTRMETINEIFEKSADLRFRYFTLENSTLMFLPASSLVSKRFYGLMILSTKLIGLFDAVPSSSNTIAVFSLQDVVIQRGIKWEHFQKLTKLVNLQLIKVHIKTLGKEFTNNVNPGLTHLSLMNTNTTKLADGVFTKLTSIYDITINNNKIRELKRSMFPTPCSIRGLSFANNMIEYLPDDFFNDFPLVKSVGLQNNRISILKESAYGQVVNQLAVLNVDKNPISCDCTIAWLTKRSNMRNVLGFCGKPVFKKGVQIRTLTEKDFDYCRD